jgi:tetratricopeptide (TPR) repeat protein
VEIYHSGYQDPALRRGKLQRDLRLLRLEEKDQPYHPFTLFNLGSVLQELGQRNEAIPLLRRSLERSDPRDSIVRKLYALLVSCHRGLHQPQAALAVCREGLTRCPDDAELLFVLSLLLRDEGDAAGAEAALLQLIGSEPGEYFASVDSGLRGHKARHNLAVLYRDQGRHAEAEILWQAALLEQPHFRLARLGLAELYLTQGRWEELEQALAFLVGNPDTALDGAVLRARALLARKEFAAAREVLDQVIAQYPREVLPRVILSYVWLQEGLNMEAAEQALRAVLTLAPYHLEAHRNLSVLLLNRQPAGTPPSLAVRYHQACSTPSDLNEHLPTLSRLARECRHVTLLGVGSLRAPLALLQAQSERLLCIGWNGASGLEELAGLAGRTAVVTQQTRSLEVELEETDLLVLDMLHEYAPLQKALHLHAGKVKRFLVIHDTTAFGEQGETPGRQGLWPAIEEFLAQETFRLAQRYDNNNGLTVLERK